MTSRAPALASLALAALLLSGCTVTQSQTAEPTPAPEETQIPEEITGQPGDPLTEAEAKQLNGQRGTLRPYEKNDGSYVIIDVKQPLPPEVKQEVAEEMGTYGSDVGGAVNSVNDLTVATGKAIILVRQITSADGNGVTSYSWAAGSTARNFPLGVKGGSADAVISQIQPWLNSQSDQGQFEIIVVNN